MRIIAQILAAGLILVSSAGDAQTSNSAETRVAIDGYVRTHEKSIIAELRNLISQPNLSERSEDIRANAELIVDMLDRRGAMGRILELPGKSSIAVFGEIKTPGAAKTVLVYGHFDGAPIGDTSSWSTPPFVPTLRDGRVEDGAKIIPWERASFPLDPEWRIYGRSASDNKAPIVAILAALDGLNAANIPLSFNVKFFFEGEEEAGSPNLIEMVRSHHDLLNADIWFFCDGPIDSRGLPRIALGVRGVRRLNLTVFGPGKPVHSGLFGNVAPNPAARLANLLASMRSDNGRILVKGLDSVMGSTSEETRQLALDAYDDEGMRSDLMIAENEGGKSESYGEAILRPAMNVLQLKYGDPAMVRSSIDTRASAVIGFRLTPGLTAAELQRLIENHVISQGYLLTTGEPSEEQRKTNSHLARLSWDEFGYESASANLTHPGVRRVIEVMRFATNGTVRIAPLLGGSLPIAPIKAELGVEIVIVPIVNADNNQHGPNENLRIQNLRDGIFWYAQLLSEAGYAWAD